MPGRFSTRSARGLFAGAALALVLASAAGCAGQARETLVIHCGAGLRGPISEIAALFETRAGIPVEINYGASNILLGRLRLRPEGDIFIPGDDFFVEEARKDGLVIESRPVAVFVPVIMVGPGNPAGITAPADLAGPDLRLGLADPRTAALGRVTSQVLRLNGLDPERIGAAAAYTAATAHDLAASLTLGHIDAAIVWEPVAREYPGAEIIPIPPDGNVRSLVSAALLRSGAGNPAARQFIDFAGSETGAAIFRQFHYLVP